MALLMLLWPTGASAAPFTPGNLVVVRIGDGTAPLTSAATVTFLLEYTPAGVLVQTIALPTAAAGTNSILTNSGSSSTDALLTRSVNGAYLLLTGYDAAVGTLAVAGTASATNNRIIGRIAADGTFDTSTRLNDAFTGGNIRSATSVNGSAFYAVGSTGGVRAVPFGNNGSTATTLVAAVPNNNRGVGTYGGNLYVSSQTATGGNFYGISQVGTGLPTTTGQTTTPLPGFPTAAGTTAASPYGFYFADLSTAVPGVDVVYVADDRAAPDGGIQKWSLVGSTWTLNGTIIGAAPRGLNGSVTGTTVSLVASSASSLYLLTDNAGYNAAPSTAVFPALATATAIANAAFRGAAFAPVASVTAPTITSFTPTTGGPGTVVTVTGTNFTGATAVSIGSFAVTTFTVVSATSITFVVPSRTGSVNGRISVTTASGTATSVGTFNLVSATVASQALPGLTVFPNPASGRVTVTLPTAGAATVALRDLTGRVVLAPVTLAADRQMALPASLAAGVYLLEVRQGDVFAVRRIEKN